MALTSIWVSLDSLYQVTDETHLAQAIDDEAPYAITEGSTEETRLNNIALAVESWFRGRLYHRYSTSIDAETASPVVSYYLSILVVGRVLGRRMREFDDGVGVKEARGWVDGLAEGVGKITEWTENSVISIGKARFQPLKDIYAGWEDEGLEYEDNLGAHYYDEW